MKKALILILSISIFLLVGCSNKVYIITTVDHTENTKPYYYKYLSEKSKDLFDKIEGPKPDSVNSFSAKEIISYTDKSVRFIDNMGHEQFISADEIRIAVEIK